MALNKFIGMGRITATPELKATQGGTSVVTFSIAVDRNYKGQNGEKQTDFLNVVAWKQTAEHIAKWFGKGSMICVEGSVQTRSYTTQSGEKRYVTEIVADSVHFTGEKTNAPTGENNGTTDDSYTAPNYEVLPEDEDLPF
jgi:single-strand DNA-binding protein